MDDYEEENRDMCPICKTDRYLSPDLRFLVNPECYHKICENCVDRIFSLGPAPCPYKRCDKILRKNKFKTQIFDDVEVEKEVDIRKRVHNVYNQTLADFKGDLTAYNKYLEDIEDIVYNLDHGIDVVDTEQKLRDYEELNRQLILNNIERSKLDSETFVQRQQREKDMKLRQRQLEREVEEEDRQQKEWAKKEIVNRLANSNGVDASEIIEGVNNSVKLKKSSARRKLDDLNRALRENPGFMALTATDDNQSKGTMPLTTPFNGDRDVEKRYSINPDHYNDPFIKDLESNREYLASGFRTDYVYDRVLTEAFMGLGCIVSEELAS
ncbi:TFIIH/NER complex subunit TFB3 KNAG_0C02840 [Huiozyma naganishii CBS 8797]|uniref:RNA polymerase II transcription factor B subunit 3 n=1 Tax=Huiozyma naganishii (strain ATCC MYA-139 / BCRC 22969 / CBS 8797 / KCTC 17520 / NBRC 10181 / NCYC 3082 / Yp74L-3) TaxID=1071383 RepID=J7R3I6_HUIN7|nr:hypothetical protein KNAG_0C02840 [Kazachstania naganishii CBS 8797]CCK69395.1 hypothetical protein KNAG_0C02840 [Kazachstania naganishii CBS 8797]